MEFQDVDAREGILGGVVNFGPSANEEVIDEFDIVDYVVRFGDSCGQVLALHDPIAEIPKHEAVGTFAQGCCPVDYYSAKLDGVAIPGDTVKLLVVSRTRYGTADYGTAVDIADFISSPAPTHAPSVGGARRGGPWPSSIGLHFLVFALIGLWIHSLVV
jgi:hypothetical protein